ncbi:MAG: UDP-3-O-(3-hydroxymyristoyl)glucosamine N-acyltransferase [Dissulfuribacterales bacterium]
MLNTLGKIAEFLNGELKGPADLPITGIQALNQAGPSQISFAVNASYKEAVEASGAGALILPEAWPHPLQKPAVLVKDAHLAYALLASAFDAAEFRAKGIAEYVTIGTNCNISKQVSILPHVHIGNDVIIRDRVTIHPFTYIGDGVSIDEGTTIYSNVTLYAGTIIGKNVIIHAGAVIGSDGFGYAPGPSGHIKIPQKGIVIIEDQVEIGANTTIDRATFGETRIGYGTKIDNLVQIGHNVQIGPHCILVAQIGIAGSAKIGTGVMIGGQAGIADHIELGDGVRVAAQSGVAKDVPAKEIVSGSPAMPHRLWLRVSGILKKLPEMDAALRNLQKLSSAQSQEE